MTTEALARHDVIQRRRRLAQAAFFALFLLAPSLDLLRWDLHEAQLWVLGQRWTLGIDAFVRGEASATATALAILGRGLVPLLGVAAAFLFVASRLGRVYCGWLCPHFSLVEMLNALLHRASGRFSVWERAGRGGRRRWWPVFVLSCGAFGTLWAITLLSYLLPPREVWGGLLGGTLNPCAALFLAVASAAFAAELLMARHLFCRFGCAVGLFQSLAWMAWPRALVVSFDRRRATACKGCAAAGAQGAACETACPMRLEPRRVKRLMFACVQCGRCLRACQASHDARGSAPSLQWTIGADALAETLRRCDARERPS